MGSELNPTGAGAALRIDAFLMSCPARAETRARTRESFAQTDWQGPLVEVIDDGAVADKVGAITATWRRLLERALEGGADFCLLTEDDLEFNPCLRHNLLAWQPLRSASANRPFFGSLYNPQRNYLFRNDAEHFQICEPDGFWGSQAVLLSRVLVRYLLSAWAPTVAADVLLARTAARVTALYQHIPSLAQHTGFQSTWGGIQHIAHDYDPRFRAAPRAPEAPRPAVDW